MVRVVSLIALAGCGRVGFDAVPRGDGGGPVDVLADVAGDVVPLGHDEDGDGVLDVDDNCPHMSGSLADSDGDGVGDICDPDAGAPNRIRLFATMVPGDQPFAINPFTDGTFTQQADSLRFDGAALPPLYSGLSMPLTAGDVRVAIGVDITNVLPTTAGEQNQFALAAADQPPLYFVEVLDIDGQFQRAQITLFDGTNYTGTASDDLATGLHTGALVLQTTQIVGVSVTLDAGWPGEPYTAQVMDAVYQGATRIEINTNNVHYEIRYLIVIDST